MSANIIPHRTEIATPFSNCSFFIYKLPGHVLWNLLRWFYHISGFISVTKSHSSIDYFLFCVIIILYEYVPSGI